MINIKKFLTGRSVIPVLSVIFLYLIPSEGYSQDKIITLNNDTIDCKITKISRNTIYFDLFSSGIRSSASLPLDNIKNYAISAIGINDEKRTADFISSNRFRLALSGGAGYIMASSDKAEEALTNLGLEAGKARSYYRNMKTGWSGNADLTFMLTPDLGAGLRYKFFYTGGSINGYFDAQDGVHLIYANYGEKIYVNYYAALISYHQFIDSYERFRLSAGCSIGMVTYRNEAEYMNSYYLITGKNIGTDFNIGLEYFFTDHIALGADLSAFYSRLSKMKMSDGTNSQSIDLDKDNYENLSRIELLLGIRFYF